MTRKDKILWSIASLGVVILIPLSLLTYLATSDKPTVVSAAPRNANSWIQSPDTNMSGERQEEYFFTCADNGRHEGTIRVRSDGLWMAQSEHSSEHWDKINDEFRTKEQAERAIETFVSKFDMCK